ncbi:MAG TPA: hypothetical protein VM241_01130 [Candidatus Thermoplasmatota archaeon]|nr:hypothetical protein [Candidatus Thermoplasmatota archaeon]
MRAWTQRSFLAAGLGAGLFLAALLVFNLDVSFREPTLRYGFTSAAVAFHAGLGLAIVGALHKERRAGLAMLASGAPVLLFWGFVYLLVQAIRNFT